MKTLRTFLAMTLAALVTAFSGCGWLSRPTVADTVVFGIPDTMTGGSGAAALSRDIAETTRSTIDGFYDAARFQIWFASEWADAVKQLIGVLESNGVFEKAESFDAELSGQNAGDKITWTVQGGDACLLEWWKKQSGGGFEKFVELQLDHYTNTEAGITARGHIIVEVAADEDIALVPGFTRNAEWVKVQFDSEKADLDGVQWMKLSATGFQEESLDPSQLDPPAPTDCQECIIEASKEPSGTVALSGSTSVPGTTAVTYFADEYEMRYYVYVGRGDSETATMNLGVPLDGYDTGTVFTDFENTVGGVISEYIADLLRDDAQLGGLYGHEILAGLDFDEPFENTAPPNPTTDDIRTEINALDPGAVDENLLTLMNVENPAYFQVSSYYDFGPDAPAGYPTAAELPGEDDIIPQSEVDAFEGAPISFADPSDDPGF